MVRIKLSTKTVPVVVETATGEELEMELCEMTAEARDKYLDVLATRMKIDASGQVSGIKRYEGLQAELLSRCLRRKSDGNFVSLSEIQTWPSAAVSFLFQEAQILNHLGKEMAGMEKNE